MKSRNICNFVNIVGKRIVISLTTSKTANSCCPCLGDSPMRRIAPVMGGVFFSSFQTLSEVTTSRKLPIATHSWCKTPKVSWSNNFETADFHLTRLYLYFWSFFKDNMSDPNSSSLDCLCCGKYICKTVDDRSDQDNERFRASRGLTDDFFSMGCFCLSFWREWKLSLNFTFWTTFVMSFRRAWCLQPKSNCYKKMIQVQLQIWKMNVSKF